MTDTNDVDESTEDPAALPSVPVDPEIDFSDAATVAFYKAANEYVVDLTDISSLLMKRQSMDSVSAIHVEVAASILASRSGSRQAKSMGAVGGVLLGTGLGVVGSVMTSATPTWTSAAVAIALVACTLGGILMAVGGLRE
jgi:phage baseplate assembly protein gpV